MSGIIANPVLYTNANTGVTFTGTDPKTITLTYQDTSGGTLVFGGGYLVNATSVADGSPVEAPAFRVLENRPVTDTSGAVTGWVVTIESTDSLGWFSGSTDYVGALAVFASVAQLSYVTYSK